MCNKNFKLDASYIYAFIFLFVCSLTAYYLKPSVKWYDHVGNPDYSKLMPLSFGDWKDISNQVSEEIVDPRTLDSINGVYTQTATRWYLHVPSERRLMVSVAYGEVQEFSKQLHRPELCYSSNGMKIVDLTKEDFSFSNQVIELNRFVAKAYARNEPVTYFIKVGSEVIKGSSLSLNLARYKMSAQGYIADGLLFRVSEFNGDNASAFKLQDHFLSDFFQALSHDDLKYFLGANE